MPALDRQELIDQALASADLFEKERRRILMIAALTPVEHDSVGTRIRVHKVRDMAGGAVEVVLHGGRSDAEYVRGALNNQKGVKTTDPKEVAGARGILMSFRAKGTKATPLTRDRAVCVLKSDPYIEMLQGS